MYGVVALLLVMCSTSQSLLLLEGEHVHVWRGSNPWGNLALGPDTQGDHVCYKGITNAHDVRNNVLTSCLKRIFFSGVLYSMRSVVRCACLW